jgi:hypothetical protein
MTVLTHPALSRQIRSLTHSSLAAGSFYSLVPRRLPLDTSRAFREYREPPALYPWLYLRLHLLLQTHFSSLYVRASVTVLQLRFSPERSSFPLYVCSALALLLN